MSTNSVGFLSFKRRSTVRCGSGDIDVSQLGPRLEPRVNRLGWVLTLSAGSWTVGNARHSQADCQPASSRQERRAS